MMEDFKKRKPELISELCWRSYAIFIPLLQVEGDWHFLFEVRSSNLKNQPGEVSFPGGAVEEGEGPQEAALRECREELALNEGQMKILGRGDTLITPAGKRLETFIGLLTDYQNTYCTDEVSRVFTVPLSYFRENPPLITDNLISLKMAENFPLDWIPQGKNYPWQMGTYRVLFYPHKEALIWGITARLLHSALALIDEYQLIDYFPKPSKKSEDK